MNEERNDRKEWSEEMLAALGQEALEYEPEGTDAKSVVARKSAALPNIGREHESLIRQRQ